MSQIPRSVHRFSVGLAFCTLALIFVGGLVTTTDSGLAVPDWPLSYGRLMPPMIGGILYEHGHRLVAATVGLLTVILAVLASLRPTPQWIKKACWGAVALVVTQGIFGGITVLLRLPPAVSIAHACLAQTFFSLVVALAVWTSPTWAQNSSERVETQNSVPLHQMAIVLFATLYLQLILGAVLRHTGYGLALHISVATMAFAMIAWLVKRVRELSAGSRVRQFAVALVTAAALQISLGVATYFILVHEFLVIPIPFWATALVTLHVMFGALVLGLSVIFALLAYRSRPETNGPPLQTKLSDYFELTKPGISFMAGITALAAFVLGSRGDIHLLKLIHTGVGTLLVAAGACALNMVLEIDLDSRMQRTKKRPLPAGRLLPGEALFAGCLMAGIGVIYLAWGVNIKTALLAALTLSVYLYVYTPLKKVTSLCTLAGAVAGALPPVMGWVAATNQFGFECWALFGIMFFWQFPHFFSLAWLYKDDYTRAGLHMLPLMQSKTVRGGVMSAWSTAGAMVLNSLVLLGVSILPVTSGLAGNYYLVVAIALGFWITAASIGFMMDRSYPRARKLFFASILYVPILVLVMVLNRVA